MVSETKEKIWIKNKILKTYFEVQYITANIGRTVMKLFRNYFKVFAPDIRKSRDLSRQVVVVIQQTFAPRATCQTSPTNSDSR